MLSLVCYLGYFLVPLFEITIKDSVGETLPADPDTFQHTITAKLMHNKGVVHCTRSLGLIGNDAAYKVGMS